MNRRHFLLGLCGSTLAAATRGLTAQAPGLGMRLVDVTTQSGLDFRHNSGAYGGKLLPETLGSGCACIGSR